MGVVPGGRRRGRILTTDGTDGDSEQKVTKGTKKKSRQDNRMDAMGSRLGLKAAGRGRTTDDGQRRRSGIERPTANAQLPTSK